VIRAGVVAAIVVLATACSTVESTQQDATASVVIQSTSESATGAYQGSLISVDALAGFASDDVRHEIAVRLAGEEKSDETDAPLQVNNFEANLQLSLTPDAGPIINVAATEAEEASAVTLANTAAGHLADIVREQIAASPVGPRLDAIVIPAE
jgi:hypothetical protein